MNPERPTRPSAIGKGNSPLARPPARSASETGPASRLAALRVSRWDKSAAVPTVKLMPAAHATHPDSPSHRIRKAAAARQAIADPRVFTKYNMATDEPTFEEIRTRWATRIGSVAPIKVVGSSTNMNVKAPVAGKEAPAV